VCCVRLDLLDSQIRVLRLKIVEPLSSDEVSYNPVRCSPVVGKIYEMVIRNDIWAAQNNREITTYSGALIY
jgi:hypothetical protein